MDTDELDLLDDEDHPTPTRCPTYPRRLPNLDRIERAMGWYEPEPRVYRE